MSIVSLFNKHATLPSTTLSPSSPLPGFPSRRLPGDLFDALLHYATADAAAGSKMPEADVKAVAATLRRHGPCNLLVFGMGHETLLWRSLNRGGRTVFLDENEYFVARLEERHQGLLEAYDVGYTTKVSELPDLLAAARADRKGDCRPVQNLLFSDCRLAINDLPNQLYDVSWDVIVVDGPRGYSPSAPGRMSAIFTAAVMARSGGRGREVEKVCSEEFLCKENLVAASGQLAHFSIGKPPPAPLDTNSAAIGVAPLRRGRSRQQRTVDRRHDLGNQSTLKVKKAERGTTAPPRDHRYWYRKVRTIHVQCTDR
ncbi:unnamed protein product [Spirodela intermedia]|uniref:Uncharacterized protein n=1 Tax=Spirodela intermedia TaxID=51605 RepID=A0A7I8IU01_SPIIN|nr:unnamed protein product [Spirodela intermedia]CAA6661435.1 unnamed protein product [Spirodela intermedia]